MSNQIHLEPAGSGKFSADLAGVSTNRIGDQIIVNTPQGRVGFNPDTLRTNSGATVTSDYKGGFFIIFPAASSSATGAALGSAASGLATGAAATATIMGIPTLIFFLAIGYVVGQCTFFLPLLYFPIVVISWIPLAVAVGKEKRTNKLLTINDLIFWFATLSILFFPVLLVLAYFNSPANSNIFFVASFVYGLAGLPLCALVAFVGFMLHNESIKNKKIDS